MTRGDASERAGPDHRWREWRRAPHDRLISSGDSCEGDSDAIGSDPTVAAVSAGHRVMESSFGRSEDTPWQLPGSRCHGMRPLPTVRSSLSIAREPLTSVRGPLPPCGCSRRTATEPRAVGGSMFHVEGGICRSAGRPCRLPGHPC